LESSPERIDESSRVVKSGTCFSGDGDSRNSSSDVRGCLGVLSRSGRAAATRTDGVSVEKVDAALAWGVRVSATETCSCDGDNSAPDGAVDSGFLGIAWC
jgi:hypothetical protein